MKDVLRLVECVFAAAAGSRTVKTGALGACLMLAFGVGYVGAGVGVNAGGWMNVSDLYGDRNDNVPASHISNVEIASCLAQSMRKLPTDIIRQLDEDDDHVDLSRSGALHRARHESVGARGC